MTRNTTRKTQGPFSLAKADPLIPIKRVKGPTNIHIKGKWIE